MRALLEAARQEVARKQGALRDQEIVVLTAGSPDGAAALQGATAMAGARISWEPAEAAGEAGLCAAGWGETARIDAAGQRRFETVRTCGDTLLKSVVERRAPGCDDAPAPRLFGGVQFAPSAEAPAGASSAAAESGPWRSFPDASFALPRWLLSTLSGRSYLQLSIRWHELRQPQPILDELAVIERVLESTKLLDDSNRAPRAPAVPSHLSELGPQAWRALVEEALAQISAGALAKVVAARQSHLVTEGEFDIAAILRNLRGTYPNCTRFAFQRGSSVFLGATPEKLVGLSGTRVTADALAGSCARSAAGEEQRTVQALLMDDKERREHAHVVAAIRGALTEYSEVLKVPHEPSIRTLPNIHHLWTPIQAELRQKMHVIELLATLHPTPAVCGVPRDAAARWIAAHEHTPRGWYAAPVGWFNGAGDGAFCVAIRSAVVEPRQAWLFAGAGLVAGSDPVREYRETAAKQRAMLTALGSLP